MFDGELTVQDVLKDPLIRQMMHADGISVDQLGRLLTEASQQLLANISRERMATRHGRC
ncbi:MULTISPECIES: hypothetical protein [Agrobacterium]|uniref:Uncharacterized protein n=1 Tax=Agrobacterium rosae TaxID=1972867 RepID=A0AAW9FKL9_9HYPH|nr:MULTISPECIES: hypothetical protein [Agrobacterium]MDX8321379.1 hypothetical protein [Agrobacterium sp. rho-8.1]MDX8305097.1 hypothetical protein [Agrobacterium rosae]MDX8310919.1 hypothetical protein [Agrobacterium sp. rho-13.3]MDX8316126.1 hypothetical protein [Agrobacterium rosae]MDX8327187.1 hypothetical protein [Agrobacterium tumefaciens]